MSFSTGTEFSKALAEAMNDLDETLIEEVQRIRHYIDNNTSFNVSHISLIESKELAIKARTGDN